MTSTSDIQQLEQLAAQFKPTPLPVDISPLSLGDRKCLKSLIAVAYLMDELFLQQAWSGAARLGRMLKADQSELGRARHHLFQIHKSPWLTLDGQKAFVAGVPERKPSGANFYPEDMDAAEFERWTAQLSTQEAEQARSFFTVIRRGADRALESVPYHVEYKPLLEGAAALLREAAAATDNASLQRFLHARADAFSNDDYFESDIAWMDMDAPIDITIGPYETYNDELFGYKASFEAYVCVRDDFETDRLRDFTQHLQSVEDSLPIDARYKNPALGTSTPIRVVNQVLSAGDGNHGVQTAAFNLPNDERVVLLKGSKKVMLKNVQRAKFDSILTPIAQIVLGPGAQNDLSFHWFFTHILAHEISHGIGPQETHCDGQNTSVRLALKDAYSAIEEAKADITALFMLQLFFDRNILTGGDSIERQLYNTFLASAFRTLRFGIGEAHGQGMAVQFNYLMDRGAFVRREDGRFEVDLRRMKDAVRDLTGEILTIEARGDYSRAKNMLAELGVLRPEVQGMLTQLSPLPVDIQPIFTTADELVPRPA